MQCLSSCRARHGHSLLSIHTCHSEPSSVQAPMYFIAQIHSVHAPLRTLSDPVLICNPTASDHTQCRQHSYRKLVLCAVCAKAKAIPFCNTQIQTSVDCNKLSYPSPVVAAGLSYVRKAEGPTPPHPLSKHPSTNFEPVYEALHNALSRGRPSHSLSRKRKGLRSSKALVAHTPNSWRCAGLSRLCTKAALTHTHTSTHLRHRSHPHSFTHLHPSHTHPHTAPHTTIAHTTSILNPRQVHAPLALVVIAPQGCLPPVQGAKANRSLAHT